MLLPNAQTSIPFSMISREMRLRVSTEIQFKFLLSKLIDSNVITVKKTKQGQKSLPLTKDTTAVPTENNTISIILDD